MRLAVSALVAIGFHAALFLVEIPWTRPVLMAPQSRSVSIDLVTFEPRVEKAVAPVKPRPRPKPKKIKPRPKPAPKVKAPVEPQPEPQAAQTPTSPESVEEPPPVPPVEPEADMTASDLDSGQDTPSESREDRAAVEASVPRYDLNPPPVYPRVARRRHYQGTVLLDVRVTAQGRVAQVRVAESSGYVILDKSAVKSVTSWRFTPARRGGRPVEIWVKVPVRYELK